MSGKFVLLIGGVPGVGKSSISGYIARKLAIDIVLSGDYLREFARGTVTGDKLETLNSSVYESWKKYGEMNRENIIRGFTDQSEALMHGFSRIIDRAFTNGEKLIIETLYFIPEMIPQDTLKECASLYLYISDRDVHRNRLIDRTNFTHVNSSGERLASHLYEYRLMMERSIESADRMQILTLDTMDYEGAREKALKYAEEHLG